ncbi:MAG: metallopeptidase TldD-related protein [Erysipelotrichaceae bacterium]|nr:metallopeptidase TldD-related protein [Erysipelotrichaceae bacterium]MDY4808899.1 metallopeptidase TldD-related protein [Bulleidia sp.]
MNSDRMIEILNSSQADAWEMRECTTEGWEFYFIRHNLDQNRTRNVTHVDVTVYVNMDDGKSVGMANGEIHLTWNEHEVQDAVARLCENARYGVNPVFDLNHPVDVAVCHQEVDPYDNARDYIHAMQSITETEQAYLNSYEIFTQADTIRYRNSNGIDVTEVTPSSMVEVIVNARKDDHEIELYRMYRSGSCDERYLKQEIEKTMQYGMDRLQATDTPSGLYVPVLFSTEESVRIYDWFISQIDTAYIYRGISKVQKNDRLMEADAACPLTIRAVQTLPNSSFNHVIDEEGARIEDRVLIDQGVVTSLVGPRRFCQYLHEDDTFNLTNYVVTPSSISEEQIRSGSYLEVVEFSGFEVNAITGDIFGEIRLGYLHDENGVTVVKGGSVSGNIADQKKDMLFSDCLRQYNNKSVPAVTCLKHLTIAGCAKN